MQKLAERGFVSGDDLVTGSEISYEHKGKSEEKLKLLNLL
jgi:hypothetical protein